MQTATAYSVNTSTPPPSARRRRLHGGACALLTALASLLALPATAARFGDGSTGEPPGYLMLVGADFDGIPPNDASSEPVANQHFGDNLHVQRFGIEVTSNTLRIDIYDPGLHDPQSGMDPANALDINYSDPLAPSVGVMRYRLLDPSGTQVLVRDFSADDATTNRALVTFFDDDVPVTPGVWTLEAELMDRGAEDRDVSVFGLSVPGYNVFGWDLVLGHSVVAGGAISQPVRLYPYASSISAGGFCYDDDPAGDPRPSCVGCADCEPICGLTFVNHDMESADSDDVLLPPFQELATISLPTPSDFWATHRSSENSKYFSLHQPDLNERLDSHRETGVYTVEVTGLDQVSERSLTTPEAWMAYGYQVIDFGNLLGDFNFPVAPGSGTNPRRIYLPADDGGQPVKERIGQYLTVLSTGPDPSDPPWVVPGSTSLEVTIEFVNPTSYALDVTQGTTGISDIVEHVGPYGASSNCFQIRNPPGPNPCPDVANCDARNLRFIGRVDPGETCTLTYLVDVQHTAEGFFFLTGQGLDYEGGMLATAMVYDTPYLNQSDHAANETFGPVCALAYQASRLCSAGAAVTPAGTIDICEGEPLTLDGSTSAALSDCQAGNFSYSWLEGATQVGTGPTLDVDPAQAAGSYDYTLTVDCDLHSTCEDTSPVVQVNRLPSPVVDATLDPGQVPVCLGDSIAVSASVSNSPSATITWCDGQQGSNVSLSVDTAPFSCVVEAQDDANGCIGSDQLDVPVQVPAVEACDATCQAQPPMTCGGGRILTLGSNPTAGISYAWASADPACELAWLSAPNASRTDISVPGGTPAMDCVYELVATDPDGCTGSDTVVVGIVEGPIAIAGFNTEPGGLLGGVPNGFGPTGVGGSGGPYSYEWTDAQGGPPTGLSDATAEHPTANQEGTYCVVVTDLVTGCVSAADCVDVVVADCSAAELPPGLQQLRGAKSGSDDIAWSWQQEPLAESGYRLYMTTDASQLWTLDGNNPAAVGVGANCASLASVSDTACTQLAATAPDQPSQLPEPMIFYQALGVCRDGVSEGCAADPACP